MTMPRTGKKRTRGRPGLRAANGFTIVELMVVLLIMLLLLAVLAPTVQKIHRTIMRTAALGTIHVIEGACRRYYEDFDEYPPSTHSDYSGWDGKELLVLFLTGYGPDTGTKGEPGGNLATDDGKTGFGFRTEKAGLVFGPYNGTEKVKTKLSGYSRPVFVDAFDEEIYYYRYDNGYATSHNPTPPGLESGSDYADYLTYTIDMRRDFILMTAGPDGKFSTAGTTDDITNFLEEQK